MANSRRAFCFSEENMTPSRSENKDSDAALYAARGEVIREMPAIIKKIIEKAKGGSYQHAKFLLEFANSGSTTESGGEDESLASLLLKELRDEPVV